MSLLSKALPLRYHVPEQMVVRSIEKVAFPPAMTSTAVSGVRTAGTGSVGEEGEVNLKARGCRAGKCCLVCPKLLRGRKGKPKTRSQYGEVFEKATSTEGNRLVPGDAPQATDYSIGNSRTRREL